MVNTPEPHSVGRHRLGPQTVGQRVVVRYLLPDGRATDVLGVCTEWGPHTITVERDGGEPVNVAVADIVTGKPVPPRASVRMRVSARDAGLHVAAWWEDQETVDLGEWVMRNAPYDDRLARPAGSALAMGDPGLPLAEAAATVCSFYAERDRPAMAQVEAGSEVEAGLVELGWTAVGSAYFLLAPVSRALRTCNALLAGRGSRPRADLPEPRHTEIGNRFEVVLGDDLARGSAVLDVDWLGVHGVEVDPGHRRRGLATAVLAELLDWGASRGATTAWSYAEMGDNSALRLGEGLGFRSHHTTTWLAPPQR